MRIHFRIGETSGLTKYFKKHDPITYPSYIEAIHLKVVNLFEMQRLLFKSDINIHSSIIPMTKLLKSRSEISGAY